MDFFNTHSMKNIPKVQIDAVPTIHLYYTTYGNRLMHRNIIKQACNATVLVVVLLLVEEQIVG